jgi:hypothetical protein
MRKLLITLVTVAALAGAATVANAQVNTATGVAVGAGTGFLIAGPPGAVVGAIIGGGVGVTTEPRRVYYEERVYVQPGPTSRNCWRDEFGRRVCEYR